MSKYHAYLGSRHWQRLRLQAIERDEARCTICGKIGRAEVHHKVPLHKGGSNALDNLTTLCRACHIDLHRPKQADLYPPEWGSLVKELLEDG